MAATPLAAPPLPAVAGDGVKWTTFLGDWSRRGGAAGAPPRRLGLVWRLRVGSGWTSGRREGDPPGVWAGSGWTGQPALVVDRGRPWLLVSSYDHRLRKVDARTGEVAWSYRFDDIVKGSPTVFRDPRSPAGAPRYVVVAGSRRGYPLALDDPRVAPLRAVDFATGRELWRLPVPRTRCRSRDCDASGFFVDGRYYAAVESGWLYALDPFATVLWRGHRRPRVVAARLLLGDGRDRSHGDDLVLEASPTALGRRLYLASGAGHLYGLRRADLAVEWDLRLGADLDGTPVPTADGRLLQAVEKQYVPGRGGLLCLDPSRPPGRAPVWFLPTGDRRVGDWQGGVVGSAAVNDRVNPDGRRPALCAVLGVDGYLYVASQDVLSGERVLAPDGRTRLPAPVVVARVWVNGGISTPVFVRDGLVVASYDECAHLYRLRFTRARPGEPGALPAAAGDGSHWLVRLEERDAFRAGGGFESTPLVWDGRVYVGCRDGWFYCLGPTGTE